MTWTELVTNLSRHMESLKRRFPNLDDKSLRFVSDRKVLIRQVATKHDLTLLEAEEEISDWLYIESLALQLDDLRVG